MAAKCVSRQTRTHLSELHSNTPKWQSKIEQDRKEKNRTGLLTQQPPFRQKQGYHGSVNDIAVPLFLAVKPSPVIIPKDKKSTPEVKSETEEVRIHY